jgi:uncharacterized glyoxalase superfamily protein PhnB
MPAFKKVVPVLRVSDMQASVNFYETTLGFTLLWRATNDGAETCMLQAGALEMLISTGSHLGGEPRLTGTLYFHTDRVEDLFDRIKDQVVIVWPLETMEYGLKEFGIRDREGYTLAFAEDTTND